MALIQDGAAEPAPSWRRRPPPRFDLSPLAALAALIAAAPLLGVAALAVFGPWTDYLAHITATRLPAYLWNTAVVGGVAAGGALAIGAPAAFIVTRFQFPGRAVLEPALALPLALPAYAAAYAWYDLTQTAGPWGFLPTVRGPAGAGLIFAFTLYPYVYLLAREAFAGQSADLHDAARTMGRSPVRAFLDAMAPAPRPALAAGLALVVMESLADYGAVIHLGAPTLSVGLIRAWAGEGASAEAARLALVLVGIAFLIFTLERMQRRRARSSAASGRRRPPRRARLGPLHALGAVTLCAIPVLLGLVIPMARLAELARHAPVASGVAQAAGHSLQLALIAGALAAALGLACAYALRSGKRLPGAAARLAGLGYAVPGSVAALGVLIVLGRAQDGLDAAATSLFGVRPDFLLTAGAAALIFAYLSRFAAAAIGPSETALSRITPALDAAARTLGADARETARRVHAPLIAPGVLLAGGLVFVEVLKELPATMILRPFNFDTLAVTAHNFASDERLGAAALPALLIAVFALAPMIWIARRITAQERAR